MKKLLFVIGLLIFATSAEGAINVTKIISPDDVTIDYLNNSFTTIVDEINDFPGSNISSGSITPDAMSGSGNIEYFRDEAFNDWVFTGLLPPTTSSTLTSTTTAGTAYVGGVRLTKDPTAKTYTATKWTFVDLSDNGTYTYVEAVIGAAEPAVTTNSIRLARVTTDGTEVTAVRDDRVTSISLGVNEDFYIKGFTIISAECWAASSTSYVTVDVGFMNHGTIAISKTSQQRLEVGEATDWHDGVVDSGSAAFYYIGIKNSGNFKFLGANVPNYHDTSGNTAGKKYYYYDATNYWRVVGAVRVTTANDIAYPQFETKDGIFFPIPQSTSSPGADSWADSNLLTAGFVPAFSRTAKLRLDSQGNEQIDVRTSAGVATFFTGTDLSKAVSNFLNMPLDENQTFQDQGDGANNIIYVLGYSNDLRD